MRCAKCSGNPESPAPLTSPPSDSDPGNHLKGTVLFGGTLPVKVLSRRLPGTKPGTMIIESIRLLDSSGKELEKW